MSSFSIGLTPTFTILGLDFDKFLWIFWNINIFHKKTHTKPKDKITTCDEYSEAYLKIGKIDN